MTEESKSNPNIAWSNIGDSFVDLGRKIQTVVEEVKAELPIPATTTTAAADVPEAAVESPPAKDPVESPPAASSPLIAIPSDAIDRAFFEPYHKAHLEVAFHLRFNNII